MPTETRHVDIHGLNCSNCAAKVERSVVGLSGVRDAAVRFETGTATFEYDPTAVSIGTIAEAVANTGCDSNRFTITVDGRRLPPAHGTDDGRERTHRLPPFYRPGHNRDI